MSKLRFGMVGCGGIAHHAHLPQLINRASEIEVTAVADIDADAANQMADKLDGAAKTRPRVAADYRDFLADVDAVLVLTPTHTHSEIAVAALQAGKPVFSEKPLARTLAQAEAMREASEKTGAPLQVGFVRRFDDEWLTFEKAVRAGAIGGPIVWRDIMSGPGAPRPWYFQDEQGAARFWTAPSTPSILPSICSGR